MQSNKIALCLLSMIGSTSTLFTMHYTGMPLKIALNFDEPSLWQAYNNNDYATVKKMTLKHNINITDVNSSTFHTLLQAELKKSVPNKDFIIFLLDRGMDVNRLTMLGKNALQLYLFNNKENGRKNDLGIVKTLLHYGVDIKRTPLLHLLSYEVTNENNDPLILKELFEHGANYEEIDNNNEDVIDIIMEHDNVLMHDIVEYTAHYRNTAFPEDIVINLEYSDEYCLFVFKSLLNSVALDELFKIHANSHGDKKHLKNLLTQCNEWSKETEKIIKEEELSKENFKKILSSFYSDKGLKKNKYFKNLATTAFLAKIEQERNTSKFYDVIIITKPTRKRKEILEKFENNLKKM